MDLTEFVSTKKVCDDLGFIDFSYKGFRGYTYLNSCCYIMDLHSASPNAKQRFQSSYGHVGSTLMEVESQLLTAIPKGNTAKDYGEGNVCTFFADLSFQKFLFEKGTRKQIAEWIDIATGTYTYSDENRRARGEAVLTHDFLKNKMKEIMESQKVAYYDLSSYRKAEEKRIAAEKAKQDAVAVKTTTAAKPASRYAMFTVPEVL